MSRFLKMLVCAVCLSAVTVPVLPVNACPMCKTANDENLNPEAVNRPRAYMYSILFMLAVPATLFTGFSIAFYRMSQQPLPEDM